MATKCSVFPFTYQLLGKSDGLFQPEPVVVVLLQQFSDLLIPSRLTVRVPGNAGDVEAPTLRQTVSSLQGDGGHTLGLSWPANVHL